jgi:hypothetical protein
MPVDVLGIDPDHGLHQGGQPTHLLFHESSRAPPHLIIYDFLLKLSMSEAVSMYIWKNDMPFS